MRAYGGQIRSLHGNFTEGWLRWGFWEEFSKILLSLLLSNQKQKKTQCSVPLLANLDLCVSLKGGNDILLRSLQMWCNTDMSSFIIWNNPCFLVLKAFYEGYKLIWPNKCCTAKYYDTGPAALLFWGWKTPRQIPPTCTKMGKTRVYSNYKKTNGTKISAWTGSCFNRNGSDRVRIEGFLSASCLRMLQILNGR